MVGAWRQLVVAALMLGLAAPSAGAVPEPRPVDGCSFTLVPSGTCNFTCVAGHKLQVSVTGAIGVKITGDCVYFFTGTAHAECEAFIGCGAESPGVVSHTGRGTCRVASSVAIITAGCSA